MRTVDVGSPGFCYNPFQSRRIHDLSQSGKCNQAFYRRLCQSARQRGQGEQRVVEIATEIADLVVKYLGPKMFQTNLCRRSGEQSSGLWMLHCHWASELH